MSDTSKCVAELYRFVPERGKPDVLLAETEREAQLEAADVWHDIPGLLFHTGTFYHCERFADGFLRALTSVEQER